MKELKPTPPPHHLTLCYPSQTPSTLITITRTSSSAITTGATTIDAAVISENVRNQPLVNREISQYPTTIDVKYPPGAPDLINNQYRTSKDQPSSIVSDTPVNHYPALAHSKTIGRATVHVYPACAPMNACLHPRSFRYNVIRRDSPQRKFPYKPKPRKRMNLSYACNYHHHCFSLRVLSIFSNQLRFSLDPFHRDLA